MMVAVLMIKILLVTTSVPAIVASLAPPCTNHNTQQLTNETGSIAPIRDDANECSKWEFPNLQRGEILFMRLEEIDLQYRNDRVKYCTANLIIAGNNYCYFQPGLCFIVGSSEFNDVTTQQQQTANSSNCNSSVWIKNTNFSIIYETRLPKRNPWMKIQYTIFRKAPATTLRAHIRSKPTANTPTETVTSNSDEPPGTPLPNPTTTIPMVKKCEQPQAQSNVDVAVPIVLGVFLFVMLLVLVGLLYRIHQRGMFKVLFSGDDIHQLNDGVDAADPSRSEAITVYSTIYNTAVQKPNHELPMSSEREIVVNELYTMGN